MEYEFVACSQAKGTIREIGPVSGQQLIITMYGTWIPEEDADIICERMYPVWCPVKRQMVDRPNVIYRLDPTTEQLKLKPVLERTI